MRSTLFFLTGLAILTSVACAQPARPFYPISRDPLTLRADPNTRRVIQDDWFLAEDVAWYLGQNEGARWYEFDDDGFFSYHHNDIEDDWPVTTVIVSSVSGDPKHLVLGIETPLHEDVEDMTIMIGNTLYVGELPDRNDAIHVIPFGEVTHEVNAGDELMVQPYGALSGPITRDAGVLTQEGRTPTGTLVAEDAFYYGAHGLTRITIGEHDDEDVTHTSHCINYDSAGTVTSMRTGHAGTDCSNQDDGVAWHYSYDDDGRIIEEVTIPVAGNDGVPSIRFAYTDRFLGNDEVEVSTFTSAGDAEAVTTYKINTLLNRITYRSTDPTGSYAVDTPDLVKALEGMGYWVPFQPNIAAVYAGQEGVVEFRDGAITHIRATHPEDRDGLVEYHADYDGDKVKRIEEWNGNHMRRRVTVRIEPARNDQP